MKPKVKGKLHQAFLVGELKYKKKKEKANRVRLEIDIEGYE